MTSAAVGVVEPDLISLPAVGEHGDRTVDPLTVYLSRQSPAAARGVRRSLAHIAELIGGPGTLPERVPWWEVRREHATVIRARLMESSLSAATVNHRLACLRGVLNEGRQLGMIPADAAQSAADALRSIRNDRLPAGRHVETGELAAIFRMLAGREGPGARRDAALLAVLCAAGPRRAEAASAMVADWRPTERSMVFPRTKGRRERKVPLPAGAVDAIEDWLAVRGDTPGPLFPPVSQGGRIGTVPMSPTAVRAMLGRRCRQVGGAGFTVHDLRRTLVGEMLDSGVDLVTTQRFIGHADPNTTARYDRRGDRLLRDAAERLHVPYMRPGRSSA